MNQWITSRRPWGRLLNCTAKCLGIHLPLSAGSRMMHLWSRNLVEFPSGQLTMALGCGLETLTPQTLVTSSVWHQMARKWFLLLESCLSSLDLLLLQVQDPRSFSLLRDVRSSLFCHERSVHSKQDPVQVSNFTGMDVKNLNSKKAKVGSQLRPLVETSSQRFISSFIAHLKWNSKTSLKLHENHKSIPFY